MKYVFIGTEQDLIDNGFVHDNDVDFQNLYFRYYENTNDSAFVQLDERWNWHHIFHTQINLWDEEYVNKDTQHFIQDLIDKGLVKIKNE